MAVRRLTPKPRKRTESMQAFVGMVPADGSETPADGSEPPGADTRLSDDQRNQIIADFEASLRAQAGVDEQEIEFALHHFKEAIDSAPLDGKLQAPDLEAWTQTLNAMVESGVIGEEERNELSWQLGQAAAVLEDDEVKVALEFAERMERDGEEQALAWLNSVRSAAVQDAVNTRRSQEDFRAPFKQSITNSKSRRLRGPPRR